MDARIIDALNLKPRVRDALVHFARDVTEISTKEIAEFAGFTPKELDMLDLFWEPTFNDGWLVLSREMIKDWFCTETGKNTVNNFYRRTLFKFNKGEDYEELDKDDPLVLLQENKYKTIFASEERPGKTIANRQYYKVTGDCFKDICQQKNADIRRYYRKVETLAILYKD